MLYAAQSNFNTLSMVKNKRDCHRLYLGPKDTGSLDMRIFSLTNRDTVKLLTGWLQSGPCQGHTPLATRTSGLSTNVLVKSLLTSSPAICTCYYAFVLQVNDSILRLKIKTQPYLFSLFFLWPCPDMIVTCKWINLKSHLSYSSPNRFTEPRYLLSYLLFCSPFLPQSFIFDRKWVRLHQ